jgi:hypothetical protein
MPLLPADREPFSSRACRLPQRRDRVPSGAGQVRHTTPVKAVQEAVGARGGTLVLALTGGGTIGLPAREAAYLSS